MIHTLDQLEPFIHWLWTCSWQASVIAVLVLLAHFCFGRWLSPRWRLALWSIVLLRLLLPATPPNAWSIFNLTPQAEPIAQPVYLQRAPAPVLPDTLSTYDVAPMIVTTPVIPPQIQPPVLTTQRIIAANWFAGALLLATFMLIAAARFNRRINKGPAQALPGGFKNLLGECCQRMAIRKPPRVILTDAVAAPALFGLLRPALLLPRNCSTNSKTINSATSCCTS